MPRKIKEEMFNGKPMSHWNREADKLVIECLVRASRLDTRSIIGAQASERLINLAKAISPQLYADTEAQIALMQRNLALVLNDCIAPDPPKRRARKKEKR